MKKDKNHKQEIPLDAKLTLKMKYPSLSEFIKDNFESDEYKQKHEKVRELHSLSKEVGIPLVNLAICWCLKNKNVSTVILGASKEDQLVQNLESLKYSDQLDKNIMEKIEAILKK